LDLPNLLLFLIKNPKIFLGHEEINLQAVKEQTPEE
jgi:hypothetical protein